MVRIRKYWFVTEFYWPVTNATGHILTRIIDEFTKTNCVNVITVGHREVGERNSNITTFRVKDSSLNKDRLFSRILKLITLSWRLLLVIFRKVQKGDTVVIVTNPAILFVLVAVLKKWRGFNLIVLVHDVFPENLVVANIIKPRTFLYKLSRKIFDFSYATSDLLITCGRDMQKTIQSKISNSNKVLFVPNFGDTDTLYPIEKQNNQILQQLGLVDKFVVLFTGNVGRMQNIENLLKTTELLRDSPDVVFLFIGEGYYQGLIKKYSEKQSNVFYLPNMNRKDSQYFLNAGDVGVASLLPNMMGVGVPSKTYSYMAAGKPIVAFMDNDAEIALLVQEHHNGWVVSPDDPQALAKLILQLHKNPSLVCDAGRISYELSKTEYSVHTITSQVVKLITELNC